MTAAAERICPHCGGTGMSAAKLAPVTRYLGQHLTVSEGLVLAVLAEHFGAMVSVDLLFDTLYGDRSDAPSEKLVQIFIYQLRKKMRGGPFVIVTHWNRRYSLEFAPEANRIADVKAWLGLQKAARVQARPVLHLPPDKPSAGMVAS